MYVYINIYMYIYIYVCVCLIPQKNNQTTILFSGLLWPYWLGFGVSACTKTSHPLPVIRIPPPKAGYFLLFGGVVHWEGVGYPVTLTQYILMVGSNEYFFLWGRLGLIVQGPY